MICDARRVPSLPDSGQSLLVRTDFTDDAAWASVRDAATAESEEGFQAYVVPVEDPDNNGATWQVLRDAVPDNPHGASVLFIVDSVALSSPEAPILVVDLTQYRLHGRQLEPFRCVPSQLWGVDNNLNISNMDWDDFAANTDDDGIFRGF